MKTVYSNGNREQNLNRLAKDGHMDLFWEVIYTLLIMEDRDISQADLVEKTGRRRTWVRNTLTADASLSPKTIAKNLLVIDHAITEITDERRKA